MDELIWHDGQLLAPDQAVCSCLDRGRLYGDGLFETMRAYSGQIFRLDAHLTRFEGEPIASDQVGPVTQRLGAAYQRLVAEETGRPALSSFNRRGEC